MLFKALWHLVEPRCCAMCDHVLHADELEFCSSCLTLLPLTEHATHRDNRAELLFADDNKLLRGGTYCFYPEEHTIRRAVQAMKFDSRPEIGYVLGKKAAEDWLPTGFFDDIDLIIPLPLHKRRLRERGYNQVDYIAKGLSEVTGIPLDTDHLIRVVNNSHQSAKSLEERHSLKQIFELQNKEELQGKKILLVDDVITSGTTMARAMQTLHAVRNCQYAFFALALAG